MISNKLRSGNAKQYCQNKMIFTESTSFTVPEGVKQIFVSGCAAGGSGRHAKGSGGLGLAGEFVIRKKINTTAKQIIPITVGMGNTIVGDLVLIAASFGGAYENEILGYKTGINGERGPNDGDQGYPLYWWFCAPGGYGGAFGYGGGGGALQSNVRNGQNGTSGTDIMGGGSKNGGSAIGINGMKPSKTYNNGGIGAKLSNSGEAGTGGGGAGGYGAGGGSCTDSGKAIHETYSTPGAGAPGIVIIEW